MSNGDQINCYVPLDALLDTRIATIDKIAGEAGLSLVSDWYHTRTSDKFNRKGTELTQARYDAAWKLRDEDTLTRTRMTFIPQYLLSLVSRYNTSHGMPVMAAKYKITINLWPYKLPPERVQQLQEIMHTFTSGVAEIAVDYIDPADLSVQYLKSTYSLCIMYEFNAWLNMHKEEFTKVQMPGTVIIAPELYLADVPDELIDVAKKTDGFAGVSLALCALCTVVFLDVRLFSYVTSTPPVIDG